MNKVKRVVVAKTGLDGHWRGVQVVSAALRDSGMEVIYLGMATAASVVKSAIEEDADVIGLSVGASYEQVEQLINILKDKKIDDMLLIIGGTVPRIDISKLKEMGVHEVFPPGSKLDDIVRFINENVKRN